MAIQDPSDAIPCVPPVVQSALIPWRDERERIALLTDSVKSVVRELSESGTSYRAIAEAAGIEANAIKQFVSRNSQVPRSSNLLERLCGAIVAFDHASKIAKSFSLYRLYFYMKGSGQGIDPAHLAQLEKFYRFVSEAFLSVQSPDLFSTSASGGFQEARFFGYKLNRAKPRYVVKSEYVFSRRGSETTNDCFFDEIISNDGDAPIVVRTGVVRKIQRLTTLLHFDETKNDMMATHIHCFQAERLAHALSIYSHNGEMNVDFFVLIPAIYVRDRNLRLLDLESNLDGEELEPFRAGMHHIRKICEYTIPSLDSEARA